MCQKTTSNRGLSRDWNNLICKNLRSNREEAEHPGLNLFEKPATKTVIPDTYYEGQWNALGYQGQGTFHFPHGAVYVGQFDDSVFHGTGSIYYPMKQILFEGKWDHGNLIDWKFKFSDGRTFANPWTYCKFPDRRFFLEISEGFHCVDDTLLTNRQPTRRIPFSNYDTEEGFFNAHTKYLVSANNIKKIIRIPTKEEEDWIIENCRKGWDEPVGYKPEFYQNWFSGKSSSMPDFNKIFSKSDFESEKIRHESSSSSYSPESTLSITTDFPTDTTSSDRPSAPPATVIEDRDSLSDGNIIQNV